MSTKKERTARRAAVAAEYEGRTADLLAQLNTEKDLVKKGQLQDQINLNQAAKKAALAAL